MEVDGGRDPLTRKVETARAGRLPDSAAVRRRRASRILPALAVGLFALAAATSASALTLAVECTDGCSGVDVQGGAAVPPVQLSTDLDAGSLASLSSLLKTGLSGGGCSGSDWECRLGNLDIVVEGLPTPTPDHIISNPGNPIGAGGWSFTPRLGHENGGRTCETAVPEPTAAAAFLVGGFVMVSATRRRRA